MPRAYNDDRYEFFYTDRGAGFSRIGGTEHNAPTLRVYKHHRRDGKGYKVWDAPRYEKRRAQRGCSKAYRVAHVIVKP